MSKEYVNNTMTDAFGEEACSENIGANSSCGLHNVKFGNNNNNNKLEKYVDKIPGTVSIDELHKITLLETAHILKRVLSIK